MKIRYICGSRADFGLMREALRTLAAEPSFELSVVLTGQSLIHRYGDIEREAIDAGLAIGGKVPVTLSGRDGLEMALAFGAEVEGLALLWKEDRPDLILILGDRGEMLAAAVAAFHLEIATGHIHGGERSGTLDEGFRHAISKLATWHFPATDEAAERLVRMGEAPSAIVKIGAPGLVELGRLPATPKSWLTRRFGLPAGDAALVVFHPVVQEANVAFSQMQAVLEAVSDKGLTAIILRPNSDAGGAEIDRCISQSQEQLRLVVLDHLVREDYLRAVASADVMIGNSSSGIIESASLGTPCVNVGSRQEGRQRNANVIDCPLIERQAVREAIDRALELGGPFSNIYGDGEADIRLRQALLSLPRTERAPKKRNAY